MQRECDVCGVTYEAKRKTSRYCSTKCRTRASRTRADGGVVASLVVPPSPRVGGLVPALTEELDAAGKLDSTLGQQALELARSIEAGRETGSGVAALSKELRAVMAEALSDVVQAADPLDELRARRDAKRDAG